ncbi:hypothetical protein A2115_01975 [Candidatus Woesebacteria bacterium GWA1_41_8]|uniref:HTH psq-type domain-containing protein n=1 Tax=Candidatus Woesebacteria bacterium GWA1_41_8 TaxID=1802471 RepID=A0A1F7WHJ3_9BACT|nr:MAG: hypothetical protein A2115_01975 [Candidatus Woesebacteria bacterium GWA1_41_8]
MTKVFEHREAVKLRKNGKSYSEIKEVVRVSKSSLSLWLKEIHLTESQIKRLKGKKERAIERFRETMRLKRENRLSEYYGNQKKRWIPLSKRELFIAGLFLYWGEGNKASWNTISISNTDPTMLKFSLMWMTRSLKIPKNSIKISLQLYSDMNIEETVSYWDRILGLQRRQFTKPYIKKTKREGVDQKGFGHGTCNLVVQGTVLKENVLMAIKAIADYYSKPKRNS